jgi:hypothetical protein
MSEVPDYSDDIVIPDQNAIQRLGKMVAEMAQLVLQEEELEDKLKKVQSELKQYQEQLIPELMTELDMVDLTTKGGIRVEMREEVRASFPKDPERRELAFSWLRSTGNEGLVKHEFKIRYGRDSAREVAKLQKLLEEFEIGKTATVEQDQTIHHQTLVAFLKRELKEGHDVPLESFGAFVQKFAKIKRG